MTPCVFLPNRESYDFAYRICEHVCQIYGLPLEELTKRSRVTKIAHPRMLAMYIIRRNTRLSLQEIADLFNKKAHGTVINACKKVSAALEDHTELQELIEGIVNERYDINQFNLNLEL